MLRSSKLVQLAKPGDYIVTMQTSAAERMRRMRERKRAAVSAIHPIFYERADWKLFVDERTLPQKAGCEPNQIGQVVLKELVDNALDAGADGVTLTGDETSCIVRDNGPGMDPVEVPRLFAVNRPLTSSKMKRLPTRGMLGNGLRVVMGAVAAFGGEIAVTSRGQRMQLVTDSGTGLTRVTKTVAVGTAGTVIEAWFPRPLFDKNDYHFARLAVDLAKKGHVYNGFPLPNWYGLAGLKSALASAPEGATRGAVLRDLFNAACEDATRLARDIEGIERIYNAAIEAAEGRVDIGELGENAFSGYYRKVRGVATIEGATVPFTVEAWIDCRRAENGDGTSFVFHPLINRSPSLAKPYYHSDSTGLQLHGCGLSLRIPGVKRAKYNIDISLIAPHLRLTGDGKAPYLGDFSEAILKAVKGAANEAYRNMVRPPGSMSVKDAAYGLMKNAYLKASDNGKLPAKARQIMYAARGEILRLTGLKKFSDIYFTQVLLPDYMNDNPEDTADWDVVYDARGNLTEPHTRKRLPLGTLQVRQYLGDRSALGPAARIETDELYPTSGPHNRYRNVLFVEKEGFDELFEAVSLAERFDIAIMSTKGMSVIAARSLLDRLADDVDNVFVLHDLDISGFSIFGTLATDSRRYAFENDVPVIDIGLRLTDVKELGLQIEAVNVKNPEARQDTLREHDATEEEIEFLTEEDKDGMCRRVELNAMTSRQLVDFVEEALRRHGVEKVVPNGDVLETHARRLIEQALTHKAIEAAADDIARRTAEAAVPKDLEGQVRDLLDDKPELSWDQALRAVL